jgi:hypothetical protein
MNRLKYGSHWDRSEQVRLQKYPPDFLQINFPENSRKFSKKFLGSYWNFSYLCIVKQNRKNTYKNNVNMKDKLLSQESKLQSELAVIMEKRCAVRKELESLTSSMLFRMGGSINIYDAIDSPVNVSYDGGNHPEYASDLYATVDTVRAVGGSFEVDLFCCEPNVYADRLSFDDVCAVHDAIAGLYRSCNAVIYDAILDEFSPYIDVFGHEPYKVGVSGGAITVFLNTPDRRHFPQSKIDRIVGKFQDRIDSGEFQYDPRTKPMLVFQLIEP